MRPLPDSSIFLTNELDDLGWTRSARRNGLRTGRFRQLREGVYLAGREPHPGDDAIAASLRYPAATISHRSAALLHGLPLVGGSPDRPDLTVMPGSPAHLRGVHAYRATLWPDHVVDRDGRAVTSIARTIVDVARHRPLPTAVAAADAALHEGLVTAADMDSVLALCAAWPGATRARRALAKVDGRSESPLESVSRLTIGMLGLPKPTPQQWIYDQYGNLVGRVDFYWDEFGVVGEADGQLKYSDPSAITREKARHGLLTDLDLEVVRWG
jgi:hypothetical protein